MYGINESPKGTRIHSRVSNDVKQVSTTIQSICPDVSEQSICDCIRLGKYSSERTRPVLVKLSRACDVHSILSSRHKLAHSESNNVSIKPFMTKSERETESTLLKERRALITSGVDKSEIKIRGNTLYVNKTKFGTVKDSVFSRHEPAQPVEEQTTPDPSSL